MEKIITTVLLRELVTDCSLTTRVEQRISHAGHGMAL